MRKLLVVPLLLSGCTTSVTMEVECKSYDIYDSSRWTKEIRTDYGIRYTATPIFISNVSKKYWVRSLDGTEYFVTENEFNRLSYVPYCK